MSFLRTFHIDISRALDSDDEMEACCKFWQAPAVPALWNCPAESSTIELVSVVVGCEDLLTKITLEQVMAIEEIIYKELENEAE